MINLTPEREAELLAQHRLKQAEIQKTNALYTKMQEDQKKKQIEFWNRINQPRIVKTEKEHKCSSCNCTISSGSKAVLKANLKNVSGSGWNGQFITEHLCLVCAKEIKKVDL
jgi:CRISPR/Cas system endoribonuclease Cas6 (RAMP superfamily)